MIDKTYCMKHYRQTFPDKGCDMCEQQTRIEALEDELHGAKQACLKMRELLAGDKRIREAAQAVVGDYGVVSSIATAGSTALMDELRKSLESDN